jgi:hypothetical protein
MRARPIPAREFATICNQSDRDLDAAHFRVPVEQISD